MVNQHGNDDRYTLYLYKKNNLEFAGGSDIDCINSLYMPLNNSILIDLSGPKLC